MPGNEPNSYINGRVMHPCESTKKQLESVPFQGSVCASYQAQNPVARRVAPDDLGEVVSRRIHSVKEGSTYIYPVLSQRVMPGNVPNSYINECVMHPCESTKKQLESVPFQGSVCASYQANLNVVKLSEIIIDKSVYDSLKLFEKTQYKRDDYWDDHFNFIDENLLPLTRFDILRENDDSRIPPIELCKKGNFYSYINGRHRHLRLLIRAQCNPNFVLKEGIHYVLSFQSEGKESEKFKFVSKSGSNLFILNVYKKSLIEVHRNDFLRRELPCIEYKNWTVKFIGERKTARNLVIKLRHQIFQPEVLVETYKNLKTQFTDFLGGLSTIFELVASVGKVSNQVKSKYELLKEKIVDPLIDSNVYSVMKDYGMSLIRILISVCRIVGEQGLSVLSLSSLLLDIYGLVNKTELFKPESLESILIAGVSTVLPGPLISIVKKMSLLTGKKLFDDNGFIFEFFTLLSKALTYIISFFPTTIKEYMNSVLDLFGLSEFMFIYRAQLLLAKYSKNKHIILNDAFRTDVKNLNKELHNLNLKKFFSKNKPLSDVAIEFERINKAVNSYEQTSRQEPCCFVFQGPPGCRKSVTVNKVIATLRLTHYSHTVKCSEDSKDWYDSYNNEDIFYMDDVGQMGKSQWRNLINWVSAVKLPLDCAEASLKDTKYFNSEIILLTTNNFTNLQGFTTKDCIETPEALWRRGYVFDFQHVIGEGNMMRGVAFFKYYDINTKQFVQAFPPDFEEFLRGRNVDLQTYCDVEDQSSFLSWITTIIMGIKALKKSQLSNNTLLEEDINFIRASNPFMAESGFDSVKNIVTTYFQHALEVCKNLLADFLTMVTIQPMLACSALVLGLLATTLIYKCKENFHQEGAFVSISNNVSENDSFVDKFETLNLKGSHSMLPKVASQMFEIDMICTEDGISKSISCYSLISGRKMLVPYHLVLDRNLQVVIYKNRSRNHRIVDHAPVNLVYKNVENDVAIVVLSDGYPSPFPKLASCFQPLNRDNPIGLVFPNKIIKIEGILSNSEQYGPIVYSVGEMRNEVVNPLTYNDLHFPGMCGTVAITNQGHILGMHVAGHDKQKIGVTLQWTQACRQELFNILSSNDYGLKIATQINDKIVDECSGIKINTDLSVYVPKNSNFVKSPLYGVFEISRQPANLSVHGPHTVKDVSKTSRSPIGPVNQDELNFAGDLLDLYFEDFDDLTEHEIVKGDEMLAPINKKSSNGIFSIKDKLDCFDFEQGTFKDGFRDLYNEFEHRMTTGDIEAKDIAWFETLKDELRNVEKKEPRSFRVSPVTMQVLTKKCFGKMVKKIVKNRWFNEIMIGINPFSEWPKLYQCIQGGRSWGGDVGKYDKCMRVQVQLLVAQKILKYYKGSLPQAARNILQNIAFNIVVINDDSWILNHSLPSGCWLTAIFNSLVNRVYTAMWYYREMKNNGQKIDYLKFHEHVSDPVFGDDRLNRCKDPTLAGFLNAITMEKFFNSLGMDMTDSLKGKIIAPFQPVEEITFLKRYFRFHPEIGKITCPLDLRTVYSTLSWLDSSKEDQDLVLRDKINAFQREIFLHYDLYEKDIEILEHACIERNILFSCLPKSYLLKLYNNGTYDEYYSKAFGVLSC